MSNDFFRCLNLPLTPEQFRRLPRNAAYKYELIAGEVWLTPRPHWYHALLDLELLSGSSVVDLEGSLVLRPLASDDWDSLPPLFTTAFSRVQPFGSLDDEERRAAAVQSLERTRTGGDGPLIERACFVAEEDQRCCGAILITLVPDVDLSDIESNCHWETGPPSDAIERRLGLPHLTWVFVGPLRAGRGVGSALLTAACRELLALGFGQLVSTFLLGNESSTLWHWRNGFRLLAHPGSWRELRRRWR